MLQNFTVGKLKVAIEIKHSDGGITFCFVFPETPDDLYRYIIECQEFVPVMILSGEFVYISKADIRAFRPFNADLQEQGYIWSFDPYTILGVDQDVTLEELHHVYVTLLKQIHPEIIVEKELHPAFKEFATDITRRVISAYEFIRAEKLSESP